MTRIIKNGKIDTRSMDEYTYNSNVEQSVIDLNKMWNGGYFSICTVTKILHRFGNRYSRSDRLEDFLDTFHCKWWADISPSMKESIGVITVKFIACKDIGYDCDAQKFIDLRFESSATRVGKQGLPAPDSDSVEIHRSKFRAIISNMLKIFRKNK